VHEKSLLLALVPASFLLNLDPIVFSWFQIIGTFSMFPLLVKDGLRAPYWSVLGLFAMMMLGYVLLVVPNLSVLLPRTTFQYLKVAYVILSYIGMIVLHLLEAFIHPPARYPDLYPALFALYSLVNLLFMYAMGLHYLFDLKDRKLEPIMKSTTSFMVPSLEVHKASPLNEDSKPMFRDAVEALNSDRSIFNTDRSSRDSFDYKDAHYGDDDDDGGVADQDKDKTE
jgi:hypothetical protein